ncbi:unnamed protein product [Ceratitis capitata]|uniref:(Mediterranean fruit fly) hypothetical protein n=1 Tax=Ceratitis capitata TaxID=7213 RepID=A0A811V894_CERCA|nr:unnamed protein product [Ceratitis capitata]
MQEIVFCAILKDINKLKLLGNFRCCWVGLMTVLEERGVNFVVANTDAQALEKSLCDKKIQLGINLTKGLGAGALPDMVKVRQKNQLKKLWNI